MSSNSKIVKVHSIETLGALDGPGLRTVIFFSGCPMRCKYCHNADMFFLDSGKETAIDDLVKTCLKYKNYYGDEGGVTLSGGEPLMQADRALALIKALKAEGINTALDTSGAYFVPQILDEVDLTILDIKHTDSSGFFELTNYSNQNALKNLEYLQKNNLNFWIRQVTVKGITDDPKQIQKLYDIAKGAKKIELLPYHSMGKEKWGLAGLEYPMGNNG